LVQIQAPLLNKIKGLEEILSPLLFAIKLLSNPISNLLNKNIGKKRHIKKKLKLKRAALQAGGRRFETCSAYSKIM